MAEPKPGSDEWLLKTLAQRLTDRRTGRGWSLARHRIDTDVRPGLDHLWDWMTGNPPIPKVAEDWDDAMLPIVRQCTLNIAPRICASVSDRLQPLGWRTALDDDEDGDQIAAEIANENQFGVRLYELWDYMLALGSGYSCVGPAEPGGDLPVVTVEDPRWTITHHNPRTGVEMAGLKVARNDWDTGDIAYLHLPGRVRAFRSPDQRRSLASSRSAGWVDFSKWTEDDDLGGVTGIDGVALTRFRTPNGLGEFEIHLGLLNRINDNILNTWSIVKYQAYRQRALKGFPDEDEDGEEITDEDLNDAFKASPGALWRVPEGVDIWESTPVDLSPVRAITKDSLIEVAVTTGMPLHYITPDAAQGSAEGASTMKESNGFRVGKYKNVAAAGLNATVSKALQMRGDRDRAVLAKIRTIWALTDRYSPTEEANAFYTARQGGLPFEVAARDYLRKGPEDLEQIRAARARDVFYDALGSSAEPPRVRPADRALTGG